MTTLTTLTRPGCLPTTIPVTRHFRGRGTVAVAADVYAIAGVLPVEPERGDRMGNRVVREAIRFGDYWLIETKANQ